jgi:hypothetical protein
MVALEVLVAVALIAGQVVVAQVLLVKDLQGAIQLQVLVNMLQVAAAAQVLLGMGQLKQGAEMVALV